jgi:uncharacterized protein YjdB
VERPDSPGRIRVSPGVLRLWVGAQSELFVVGTYKDAGDVDISKSTRLGFESESPAIASVTKNGKVTGVSAGSTSILVNREAEVKVVVADVGRK